MTAIASKRPARRRRAGHPRRRLLAILTVFCLLFGSVVVRLAQLQIVGGERYVALGDSQRIRPVELAAARGAVFDRNGAELALSVPQRSAWADPQLVVDAQAAAGDLAPVLSADPTELAARLGSDARFVYLGRQLPDAVADRVEALELDGVFLLDEPKRFTPSGSLAQSVIGAVDVDNVGASGLEHQYDDVLTGDPGQLVLERDPEGRTIPAGDHELTPATPGDDLMLSIDRALQFEAERLVASQIESMGAKAGTIIVTNPQTGEVLAMANLGRPSTGAGDGEDPDGEDPDGEASNGEASDGEDPDGEASDGADRNGAPEPTPDNRAVTVVYEPGSVNKVITMAAALEEGITTPTSVWSVPDNIQIADKRFTDSHPHPVEQWTPTDIMAMSSNVGTIMLGQQLGPERIDNYLRRFGFGQRTALGFPGESPGILLDPQDWSGTAIGSIPIGQTIAVTAMQMLAAYNVIANGGVYVEPTLVLGTVDENGVADEAPRGERRRVVSEDVANQVRDMMVDVVDVGTGTAAAIDGYQVAGKTGTARKSVAGGGYQDADGNYHYVTTFAGFVPAEDPQLSIIVVIDEPTSSIFASAASAPVFADLARYALRSFRIPPPASTGGIGVPIRGGDREETAAPAPAPAQPGVEVGGPVAAAPRSPPTEPER